jgi:hypothetical protein
MVSGVGQCTVKLHVEELHWLGKCSDHPVAYSADWALCGTCLEQGVRGGEFEEEWVVKLRLGSVTQTNEPLHNRKSVAPVCNQHVVGSIGMQS